MSTTPRIGSAVAGEPPSFGTALAHAPSVARAFGELYATFWSDPTVDNRTKEVTRIRNARVTDCGY